MRAMSIVLWVATGCTGSGPAAEASLDSGTSEELAERYDLPDDVGYPEGMGFNASGRAFYVSSLAHGSVFRVDAQGVVDEVVIAPEGLWSTLGVTVDGDDVLVCAVRDPSTPEALAELWVHDALSGDTERIPLEGAPANCNDLTVVDDAVYLTDREAPVVHRVDLATGTAEVWFTHVELTPQLIGTNGLRFDPEEEVFLLGQYAPARLPRIPLHDPEAIEEVELINGTLAGFLPDGADGITWLDDRLVVASHGSVRILSSLDGWRRADVTTVDVDVTIEAVVEAEGRLYGLHGAVAAFVLGTATELPFQLVELHP